MMNVNENKELKNTPSLEGLIQTSIQPTGDTGFKDEFNKLIIDSIDPSSLVQNIEINPMLNFEDLPSIEVVEIDTKEIENADAMFFLNISSNAQNINLQLNDEVSVIDASNYKTIEVSKTLGDMLIKASKQNQTLRLDFDNQVTVVLKVAADGKIDTTFFPRDKEVENYLKNNIDYLKVRFDEQNIAYSNISYKPYKQNKEQNKQGEKSHEWCIRKRNEHSKSNDKLD